MARDLYSNISATVALTPAVQGAGDTGSAIDLAGARGVAFIVSTGAVVGDGDFGCKLQESDLSGSGFTDVAADFVDTDAPATLEANSAVRLGYRGNKRYVRVSLTKAGGTSIIVGAVAVIEPLDKPAA